MCTLKKNVNHLNILKKSVTNQKIDLKRDLANNLIEKLLGILRILKKIEFSADNNFDDKNLDEMEALLIDVPAPPSIVLNNKNSKVFFILLGFVEKAEKMAIKLANRLFSHFYITIENVSPNGINSANAACGTIDTNLFAYIAINRYLADKFWKIIIDTNVSKHFIASYGQLMAYINDIKFTIIHISKVGAIHVQFGINSILSMGFVYIQTPIGYIKFYIVKADTLFLLCLTNMD